MSMNTRRVNEHLHAPIPACEETNHVIHRQAILRCGHTSSQSLTPNTMTSSSFFGESNLYKMCTVTVKTQWWKIHKMEL